VNSPHDGKNPARQSRRGLLRLRAQVITRHHRATRATIRHGDTKKLVAKGVGSDDQAHARTGRQRIRMWGRRDFPPPLETIWR
jgi:hypothetical protein